LYKKLPIPIGFVKSENIFSRGIKITVRTLEGDLDILSDENINFMIGVKGEVYPIKKVRFDTDYDVINEPYNIELEYTPLIINRITGEKVNILNYSQTCVPKNEKIIRARKLDKPTKVFTNWDTDKYFSGEKGDWLAANENSYDDCYIFFGNLRVYVIFC
jgi:phosphoglycolate phosphatase